MNENVVSWSIGSLLRLTKPKAKLKSPQKPINKRAYQTEHILDLLSKPKKQRTKMDTKIISEYLATKYDYFSKIKETSDALKLEKICSVLNLEEFSPGQNIINFGEEGDKFYIVLEGLVGVYIPVYPQKTMLIKEYAEYMKNILQIEKKELKYNRIDEKNAECRVDLQFLMSIPSETEIGQREMSFFIEEYDKVGEFGEGFKFGEIALIKKTARNATITAINNTKLLSIEKSDYNKSIRELEERRLEKQLNDFKIAYPLFQHWTLNHLIKLFNCFSKQVLTKGDYVYKQNEDSDSVYIILSGVFEVYSMVSLGWVDAFFPYIKDAKHNLLHFLNTDKPYQEKALREIFTEAKKNAPDSPCRYDPLKIAKITSSYHKDKDIIEITQQEEDLMDPYNIFKVHIKTINYKDVIGVEEGLEMKKRFSFVRCVSPFAEVQKVKLYDFFRLINLNPDHKNKNTIQAIIAEKKCILYNQLKKAIITLSEKNKIDFKSKIESYFNIHNTQLPKSAMRINKCFNKSSLLVRQHTIKQTNSMNNSNAANANQYYDLVEKIKFHTETAIKTTALSKYTSFTMEKSKEKEGRDPKEETTTTNSCIQNKAQANNTFSPLMNVFRNSKPFKSRTSNNRIISPSSSKSISSFIHFTSSKSKIGNQHYLFSESGQRRDLTTTSRTNIIKFNTENNKTSNANARLNGNNYRKALELNYDVFQSELFKIAGVKRKEPMKEIFGTVYDENDSNVLQIESYMNDKGSNPSLTTKQSKSKSSLAYALECKMKNFTTLRKSKRLMNLNI